ncbi:hypothetical protein J5N97_005962 [Dioscorea zingiberensis]|uniref:cytokinin dehydrogenase n=1 Tax=Dioscorea zingiberensis TaxID=325984 RepID=A0A9D5D925_9LILI|nr:hypothetical protein J5N97_005962 [Dioscorea zingiberensis]
MMIAYLDQRLRLAPGTDVDPCGDGGELDPDLEAASKDFGGVTRALPAVVRRPCSGDDVVEAIRLAWRYDHLTVAPRGNGHSVAGQALAPDGIVLNMRAMSRMELVRGDGGQLCADVGAGVLWGELLEWGVAEHGLSPASWTDYLGLTVGGTLSNAGISGQAFRKGPQISNVAELEVVTGEAERVVCSPERRSDLFYAALGGLGQFGVITRARIPLLPAPPLVRWIRVVYASFEVYAADVEWLVARPEREGFNYIEGFAFVNRGDDQASGWESVPIEPSSVFDPGLVPPSSGPLLYCLELGLYHDVHDGVDKRVEEMLRPLKYIRGLEFTTELSYVDFLSRVNLAESAARANGSWHAPHPWLNILISASDVVHFDRHVLQSVLKDGIGGPMLVYPLLRSKWDPQMSVALPDTEVFYLVALLRFNRPYPAGPPVENLMAQNREILTRCKSNGYDFKLYLPHYKTEAEWAHHFGKDWARFVERKARFDPRAILSPGQLIFTRAHPPSSSPS